MKFVIIFLLAFAITSGLATIEQSKKTSLVNLVNCTANIFIKFIF